MSGTVITLLVVGALIYSIVGSRRQAQFQREEDVCRRNVRVITAAAAYKAEHGDD